MRAVEAVVAFARGVTNRAFAEREIVVKPRDALWVVELGRDHVAFVARDAEVEARLTRERRVLARIAPRVPFAVPRPLGPVDVVSPCDVRERVRGATGTAFQDALVKDDALARRAAVWMADALADLHAALVSIELDALGLERPAWPFDAAVLRRAADRALDGEDRARAVEVCARWEAQAVAARRSRGDVLLHGDFGAHNLAFDPATGMPIGVFDFHDVGRGAAEHDLKLLPLLGETFLARAVDRYAARARPLDLGDVRLVHAATALSSLAEGGDAPSAVRWAREAVRAATAQA